MLEVVTFFIILTDIIALVFLWRQVALLKLKLIWSAVILLLPLAGPVFYFVMFDTSFVKYKNNR